MNKINKKLLTIILMIVVFFSVLIFSNDKDLQKHVTKETLNTLKDIITYEMSEEDIRELPSTEIVEQTLEDEKIVGEEQSIEKEGFELQDEENISYEGEKAKTWNVELGNYIGLTYYSQIDSRWSGKMYSSINNKNQTIGTSGCGPTTAAMVVTAVKGVITPFEISDLFVKHGYRSSNNGTYWSAFRSVADEFNIDYQETSNIDYVVNLIKNNNYVICSVGNGLFTTGGHFIVITGIEGDTLKIYDPYLYSGKFETSTRRGKVNVNGNTIYCSVSNFKDYANAKGFFVYKNSGNIEINDTVKVTTANYTRYVNVNTVLNVRTGAGNNFGVVDYLKNGEKVTVYETFENWSKIDTNKWVFSNYLSISNILSITTIKNYPIGKYKVNTNILNVRTGAGTNFTAKTYKQLTNNAKIQNKTLGNYYTSGYKKGVICAVTKTNGEWGLTSSGWINLKYCIKI